MTHHGVLFYKINKVFSLHAVGRTSAHSTVLDSLTYYYINQAFFTMVGR